MYSRRQSGFTMVEMLAVVAIVAIILGLAAGITWSLVKDTDVQEFVSNASNLEEASNLYYRDEGVLPYNQIVASGDITEKSKLVMENELNKLRVPNARFIVDTLIDNDYITTINYEKLKDYTRIKSGDTGTDGPEEFVVINVVDNNDLGIFNGYYENDIAGFVFSKDVVLTSDEEIYYSGAYKYDENEPADANRPDAVNGNELYPFYLRIDEVIDNEDGTADITFVWEDTWVLEDGDRARGYTTDDYVFNSPDQGDNNVTEANKLVYHTLNNYPVRDEETLFSVKGLSLIYLKGTPDAQNVGDSNIRELRVNIKDYIDDSRRDTEIPIDDDIVEEVPEEDDYYRRYREYIVDPNNVTAVEEGIRITGLNKGVRIVMKEVRRNGSNYSYDPNRTRVFRALESTVLIPKNPYLQKDFQENTNSTYEYILEFYEKVPIPVPKPHPDHAINIYYD